MGLSGRSTPGCHQARRARVGAERLLIGVYDREPEQPASEFAHPAAPPAMLTGRTCPRCPTARA